MDYNRIASDILEHVGGKENVKNVTHCFTRLRFVLRMRARHRKRSWNIWRALSPL